jgi:LAO/AO transport system kinase
MEHLVRNPNVFIRPTPAGTHLGGVANKTRESILLCESAGYDIIIIETVGVGQSEISVYEMVDYFVLLKLSGAGDELQGIKRGIIEMADSIIINKADGQNKKAAELAKAEFKLALSLYPLKSSRWKTKISTCSSLNSVGVKEIWEDISNYIKLTRLSGYFQKNRNNQKKYWLMQTIKNTLHHEFFSNTTVKKELDIQIKLLESNKTSVIAASEKILNLN